MDDQANARFRKQLPFGIRVLGRDVTFSPSPTGRVAMHVSGEPGPKRLEEVRHRWELRKSVYVSGPEHRNNFAETDRRLSDPETIRAFLRFFVAQPVGPRLFIFDMARPFESYVGRTSVIDEALMTWDALTHWPKDGAGKLCFAIPCAGYRARLPKADLEPEQVYPGSASHLMCNAIVSDTSGLCSRHQKPGTKTLFNFYPFFKVEGFPELA